MEIIPAVLAEKFEDGLRRLKQADSFVGNDVVYRVYWKTHSFQADQKCHCLGQANKNLCRERFETVPYRFTLQPAHPVLDTGKGGRANRRR